MEIDSDKLLLGAIKEGIASAVKAKLEGYNSPIEGTIKDCVKRHEAELHSIINEAISACVRDAAFKEDIIASTRQQLARALVQRIGGELESQVNKLKSDPTTRARITMAINAIVAPEVAP